MAPFDLDSRFTFDSFVVGSGNRLTCAAARRVAESPGTSYNPLFIYSASGLGKTHLLMALGHHARRIHEDLAVVYDTLDHFMAELTAAIEAGNRDQFRDRLQDVGLLLLDDVQFLAGHHRSQEELIQAWDALLARGGQVVLTSDRPPGEIDGLDDRLLSRFSGGLIVDITAPEYETRVAIVNRKAGERGQHLLEGVAEAIARISFGNVRELQGALNRLIAIQELEGRSVGADEVDAIVTGAVPPAAGTSAGEFDRFMAEIAGAVGELATATAAEQAIAEAIMRWEAEGYRTRRLEGALAHEPSPESVEALLRQYESDVERLRDIAGEITAFDAHATELARLDIFRNPDRVADAQELLGEVRERSRPLPAPPPDLSFATLALPDDSLAVRAARAAAERPGLRYNPLFLFGPERSGKTAILGTLAAEMQRSQPEMQVAFTNGAAFAAELIQAIERNHVDGWRERWRRAGALIVDDVDALMDTERAQEELFHLFDALHRGGAQLAFGSRLAARALAGMEARLRTRLESGLVIELEPPSDAQRQAEEVLAAARVGGTDAPGGAAASPEQAGAVPRAPAIELDDWFLDREKLPREWPQVAEWLIEELD
jgi:chromosomal replication initiation ATPase DnaA